MVIPHSEIFLYRILLLRRNIYSIDDGIHADSAIDIEQGYRYDGGSVVAIMPSGGMTQEVTHCKNFSSIGSSHSATVIAGRYLNVTVDVKTAVVVQMPSGLSAKVIYLGSNGASVSVDETTTATLDENGV